MMAPNRQQQGLSASFGGVRLIALLLVSMILAGLSVSSSHETSDEVRTKAITMVQASVVSPKAGFDGNCEAIADLASPEPPADYFVPPPRAKAEARRDVQRRLFNARAPPAQAQI